MSLEIGNIVTVVDEELLLYDKQGEVVDIKNDGHEDGPYCVKFGASCDHLLTGPRPRNRIVRFSEKELRKDERWEIKTWADNLYGDMWHSAYNLPDPWTAENECMHEEHGQTSVKSTVRILVNCWGTVYEMDMCDAHRDLHGKCGEILPIRKTTFAA